MAEMPENGKSRNGVLHFLLDNSLFMVIGVMVALLLANTQPEFYHDVVHNTIGHLPLLDQLHIELNLHFLINDMAMAFFFLIAAIEIRESMLPGGALHDPRKAALPLLATVGGVAGPALLFYVGATLFESALQNAWAVPTATDIAFSYLVARLIFGKGHPALPFLLLLAIADDAIGLIILAVFYPSGVLDLGTFTILVGAALVIAAIMNKVLHVRSFWWYLVVCGTLSWFGFHLGGIHAALALVPIVWFMPHEKRDEGFFEELEHPEAHDDTLSQMEEFFRTPVELMLFFFALANAGVVLDNLGTGTWLVTVALVVGKPLGIVGMTWFGTRFLGLRLPEGMNIQSVIVLGMVAGIGFTVALFVAGVAVPAGELQDQLKLGALLSFSSSILAAAAAFILGVGRFEKRKNDKR